MDLREERQGRKGDRGEENNAEKTTESKPVKSANHKRVRKNEPAQKSKNSRPNSAQNRRKSSRSRSRSQSQSRQPLPSSFKKSWKSANAWLNFMQDFRERLRNYPALRKANVFRLAGEQWKEMSPEEKKPYIDGANKIRRRKELENGGGGERKKTSNTKRKITKSEAPPKNLNQKKRNRAEKNDEKSDSESDSETEASGRAMESDNASVDTDES